jgi:23S rRNA (guanosine2251-2'-O)-methyltransferase
MFTHYTNVRNENRNEETGLMIYGIRAVSEAIIAGKEFDKLFVQEGLRNDLSSELLRLAKKHEVHYQFVPGAKIQRIAAGKNHQGVVAYLSSISYSELAQILPAIYEKGETPLLLILDRITDVRNFGAIARTAECAGVHAIIIPTRGAAPVSADAVKTSAGALHSIPVCREDNLKDTIDFLKESGVKIAACTEKGSVPHYEPDLSEPLAIIMGSEEDGISGEYLKRSDIRVLIPMSGSIASLNVSVATGIILFEAIRQRNQKK